MKKLLFILAILFLFWLIAEIYCRIPDQFKITKVDIPKNTQTLVLLFHGSNDHLNPELKAIAYKFKIHLNSSLNAHVINYNWSHASSYLRASANTMKIGDILGSEISNLKKLKHIRLIGHSAGAFIADSLCQSYRNLGGDAHIEINFLDPFSLRGFSDINYGVRSFGKCANFSSSIINTDDSAPTTNTILKNAWNLDVTNLDYPKDFKRTGHYFPPLYYLLSMNEDNTKMGIKNHNIYPRGDIVRPNNIQVE